MDLLETASSALFALLCCHHVCFTFVFKIAVVILVLVVVVVVDRVLREVIRWAMRKLRVEEWLVSAVMSVYTGAKTV